MKIRLLAAVALLCASPSFAELKLATPFTDGVILQRQMNVPVWGTADAGATVTVSFAGQSVSAAADANGAWKAVLAPLAASTPCDVGIGNNAHPSNPDWTRVGNGEQYAIRRLTVMVK